MKHPVLSYPCGFFGPFMHPRCGHRYNEDEHISPRELLRQVRAGMREQLLPTLGEAAGRATGDTPTCSANA